MRLRNLPLLLGPLGISLASSAQTTRVSGHVTDGATGEPLPFVNVGFVDSRVGTNTDFDGYYKFDTYYATDSLRISAMGYKPLVKKVKKDHEQVIDFVLEPSSAELKPVEVVYVENAAFPILRQVVRNKPVNNRAKLAAYQYENYNKVEFDLNNITDDFKNRKLFKGFKFIFDYMDSSGTRPYLPIFMTETLSDVYYRQDPHAKREVIKGSRVSGIENESIIQFMGDMYQNVNIYENFINIFGKNFISPIADGGKGYYDYLLLDSNWVGHNWCYRISFKPSHKQELAFSGDMWINDTTFAVRRIDASVPEGTNINFVQSFDVHQEYDAVQPEVYMLTRDELVADLNVIKDSGERNKNQVQGIFGRRTASYRDFVINKPKDDAFYAGASEVLVEKDPRSDSESYWLEHRHMELSTKEAAIYEMVDTLKKVPEFRTFVDIVNTIVTGYYKFEKVEIGPYFNGYSFNPVEGHRFRMGIRTTDKFSKEIEYSGFLAYGTDDGEFKYGAGIRGFLSKDPRQLLGVGYQHDVEQLGQSPTAFRQDNLLSSILRRSPNNKLTMVDEYKVTYERDWFQGFSSTLMLRYRKLVALGNLIYMRPAEAFDEARIVRDINTAEVVLNTRFAYHEKYLSGTFQRIPVRSKYPVLDLHLAYGIPHLLKSDYEYERAVFKVSQRLPVGVLGNLRYAAEVGKVWGTLAYPLLVIHPGNETFYYDEGSFNTMNFFEFLSDRYASLAMENHFDGFFFNRIPLLRKLKWREVATFKALVGELDPKHTRELMLLPTMHTLVDGPFMEAGAGIENILKCLRVDAVWRLTYRNVPNADLFAIRAKISIRF